MPTVFSSFDLKPINFFENNAILGVENDLSICKLDASARRLKVEAVSFVCQDATPTLT